MKLSTAALIKSLSDTNKLIPLGAEFFHYKGGSYRITDLVINQDTQKVMVVYVPLHGTYIKYTRPADEWFEICDKFIAGERNGPGDTIKKVPRFDIYSKYQEIPDIYSYKD